MSFFTILFTLSLFCKFNVIQSKDSFSEELYIKPLTSGHIFSYFQFTTIWEADYLDNPYQHCHLFPRALGEILQRYHVQELHISLTEGLWRHEKWGYPVYEAPPGAEIWVWFINGTRNVDATWKELTSSLSGLLCASLNFIDTSNTMSPKFSFRPAGVVDGEPESSLLRYGTLPREIVCTENLTPWKKLLPCDSRRGLATLLNAGYIHNTNYHSLGIHLRNICRDVDCNATSIELRQTVSLVYDLVIVETGSSDFSIRKLFGSGLHGPCPLADMSKIYIETNRNDTFPFALIPPPMERVVSVRGGYVTKLAVYDVKALQIDNMFNIAVSYKKKPVGLKSPPILSANRFISGYGQQKGGIVTKLYNNHWKALSVVVLENIPWFVPVYLHTLKIVSEGVKISPNMLHYVPGKQRLNPTHLELVLSLPPRSVTTMSIDLDFTFLKWQEYPPDASHGFYIGSSVLTCLLPLAKNYTGLPQDVSLYQSSFNASRDAYLVQIRTESVIITLPTPDFSMPYNVICLACTVVALAFGPIHNITTKRLRIREVGKPQGLVPLLIGKVKSKLPFGKKPKVEEPKVKEVKVEEPKVEEEKSNDSESE